MAKEFIEFPENLENIWVYDDEFVKGMIRLKDDWIQELYVDTFFQNQGVGTALIHFAITQMNCKYLWVLEKNKRAIDFYTVHGFMITGEKQLEEGITEYIIKMERR